MKEAKLSVSNNITNTTETHERGRSWKTQEQGPLLEAAILYRNDPRSSDLDILKVQYFFCRSFGRYVTSCIEARFAHFWEADL